MMTIEILYHLSSYKYFQYIYTQEIRQGTNNTNSTAADLLATTALFTTSAASEQYPATASGTAERFVHFMLNERTRELCGAFYRWEDLVRTETLLARTQHFNADATTIQPHHKLRPIPAIQIDATTINGQLMTNAEKTAYQNEGYQ